MRMKRLKNPSNEERSESPDVVVITESQDSSKSDEFESYLDSLVDAAQPPDTSTASSASETLKLAQLDAALAKCQNISRAKHSNVWDIIDEYPDIIKPVAIAVSCLPTTQVSVERLFSHLKLVLRENRSRMAVDLLEAILFLRTNKLV